MTKRREEFNKLVKKKYFIYNSLFLDLPYTRDQFVGIYIPLLYKVTKEGLEAKKRPVEILDSFFSDYIKIENERDRIDFMFKVVQYVERQIVLYDAIEDAAFPVLQQYSASRKIKDFVLSSEDPERPELVTQKLNDFSARLVFTAHPTQFYSSAILDVMESLRQLVKQNKINEIDLKIQQLGLTSLINRSKPTPLDEAENIIYFLRYVYYNAVGQLYTEIKDLLGSEHFDNPDLIKLGFWPGGDRDGNPFVTAEVTMAVSNLLRMTLMKCYYHDVKALLSLITFKGVQEVLDELKDKLYVAMFDKSVILSHREILEYLDRVLDMIRDFYHRLFEDNLIQLIDKVKIFKSHFAALDIRQDHSVHKDLIREILQRKNIISKDLDELGTEQFISILTEGEYKLEADDFQDPLHSDTIRNIYQLHQIQEQNGEDGCNRYIISNSEDVFSVLFVFALFRWCGYREEDICFDIVPLFETMDGMENAKEIMRTLYKIEVYNQHLERRGRRQTMMLGFSDGTKDGGYLKANWAIYKTKEELSDVTHEFGLKAIFFDGRGGPPARGGGMTHRFYASQGPEIQNHEIQLTIQGQTISSIYGTVEQFSHNCEQLITAGISNELYGESNRVSGAKRQLIEDLAMLSFEKYHELKKHEKFIPYLEKKSTLRFYGRTKIGSRPGKRGKSEQLTLKDLRAISFVGAWSQLKQNVPGYFGLGTAIRTLVDQGRVDEVIDLYKESDFFKALVKNCMMSLTKSFFALTTYMKEDPEFREFWGILKDEYELTKEMVLLISGSNVLMEHEEISRVSIQMREDIVLPLLVIQQNALQKLESPSDYHEIYEKLIVRSLYGNINASRNAV